MDRKQEASAAVTGVAQGSLGTGTALEDTQEWVIPEELQASTPAAKLEPVREPAQAPAQVAAPVVPAVSVAAAREPDPARVQGVPDARPAARPARARHAGGIAASPRTAGVAAVVLLALVGLTAVVTSQDRAAGDGGTAPAQATEAPTAAPPADAGGIGPRDNGKGNGKGNGNGKDNGKGNDD